MIRLDVTLNTAWKSIDASPSFVVSYLNILGASFLPPFDHDHKLRPSAKGSRAKSSGDTSATTNCYVRLFCDFAIENGNEEDFLAVRACKLSHSQTSRHKDKSIQKSS
jgi:hypothetical protein